MSWRVKVEHRTGMRYASPVTVSFNEARMTPADGDGQALYSHELHVTPPARIQRYLDYWSTQVEAFDVHEPHTILEVVATSLVDTSGPHLGRIDATWDELGAVTVRDEHCEMLTFTSYVDDARLDPARADLAQSAVREATPAAAVAAIVAAVQQRLQYQPGVTTVSTTASQAWDQRAGVCQDFTHVTLSLLRSCGIPARYVSGYLYKGDGAVGETMVGESHAWIEAWVGSWLPMDPTNGLEVAEAHIVVARGRDYGDVSPLKGIYAGGRSEALGVEVALTRLPR